MNDRSTASSDRLAHAGGTRSKERGDMSSNWTRIGAMTGTAMALALAACNQSPSNQSTAAATPALPALPQAEPLQAGPATALASAPAAAALPAAAAVKLGRVSQPSDA